MKLHREAQDAERDAAGDDWADAHDLIFTMPNGSPIGQDSLTWRFDKLLAAAELVDKDDDGESKPRFIPRGLRKTCSDNWIRRGLSPEVVADLLGHADRGQTVRKNYYSQTNTVLDAHVRATEDD